MNEGGDKKGGQAARIVTVVPVGKGIHVEELTYFTTKDVSVGALVTVPIGRKITHALVVHVREAGDSKSEVRTLPYGLKKIVAIKTPSVFLKSFIGAIEDASHYFAASAGSLLYAYVPSFVLEKVSGSTQKAKEEIEIPPPSTIKHMPFILQSGDDERIAAYKGIVREEFARGHSVFICFPEVAEIERMKESLSRGISEYAIPLHSGIPPKKLAEAWERAVSDQHPLLILATGQFLSLPRPNIRTIIIEKESARAYKMLSRPYADVRTFAELLSQRTRARLILGDMFLRPETLARLDEGDAQEFAPPSWRTLSTARQTLIDTRAKKEELQKEFKPLSEEIAEAIRASHEESENVFLFVSRKGLYPLTICSDCGNTVLCKRCSAPLALHGEQKKINDRRNIFLCHKCGAKESPADACAVCGGWKFALLGIGSERVEEEVKKIVPETHVFRLDRESASTHKKATAVRDAFFDTPGAVMIGTEMAVPYLDRDLGMTAAVSIDSFFFVPDFRINERAFSLLLRLRARARKKFLIQTRDPENRVFTYALSGNTVDFYREEIAERKALGYPPFTTLIKITREGREDSVRKDCGRISETFAAYKPEVYESRAGEGRGKFRMNVLLRIKKGEWPNDQLIALIRGLPPHFAVAIDPESLL